MNELIKRCSENSYLTHTRQKKGITLIALVITIVVLMILAGVTINLVLGENGILVKAQEARTNYVEAAENEKTKLDEILNETDKIIAEVESGNTNPGGNKEETVLVTGVTLNKTNTEILVACTETLVATIQPNNASNKTLNWTSSDENIATVDENGVITGVSAGTTTIVVTTDDGGKTASCLVKVRNIENVIDYSYTSEIWKIFDKAKELGYVTTYESPNGDSSFEIPVSEYSIACYYFNIRKEDQYGNGPFEVAYDYKLRASGPWGSSDWVNYDHPSTNSDRWRL